MIHRYHCYHADYFDALLIEAESREVASYIYAVERGCPHDEVIVRYVVSLVSYKPRGHGV